MIKYTDTKVVFREFPDEITLAINISGCPNHCKGCHSPYLAEDIGYPLNIDTLHQIINSNLGITCVGFMGGDQAPIYICILAKYIKKEYPNLKVGWYSGKPELPLIKDSSLFHIDVFDYIKLGQYIIEKGPLNNPNTNQRLYEVLHEPSSSGILEPIHRLSDITYKFWK